MAKTCPECGSGLTSHDRQQFTSLFGRRKIRPCPYCGRHIRWSVWFLVLTLASYVFIGLMIALLLTGRSEWSLYLLALVSIVLIVLVRKANFESVTPGNTRNDDDGTRAV